MKSIKAIGLVALAVLSAMALVGASSAMAEGSTQLCKVDTNGEPCPAASVITHVHAVTLPGAKAKLLVELNPVECDVLFLGDTLGLANPLVIHGHFTYTECELAKIKCEVKEVSNDTLINVLRLGHELADVTGEGEVRVRCALGVVVFIDCTYNGKGLKGHGLGPLLSTELNGEVVLEEQEVNPIGGPFCPAIGKLDILMTPLEKVYVTP